MLTRRLASCGCSPTAATLPAFDREFSRAVNAFFGDAAFSAGTRAGVPPVNVFEGESEVLVECELPGLSMSDLDVHLMGRELTIRGKRPDGREQTGVFHRRERTTGEFSRTLRLGMDIESQTVSATLVDGVLTITLPKAASAKPRKIEIKN